MPYNSMEDANPALKGIKPPVTLAQANQIAAVADSVTGVDSPWAVAISQFKKAHVVKDGKWVKKDGSTWGGSKKSFLDNVAGTFKAIIGGKAVSGTPDAVPAHGSGGTFSSADIGDGAEVTCECLDCGHKFSSAEHCADVTCPECGSDSCRRADRPGVGQKMVTGIKAFEAADGDKYLVLWTSNAFKDREKETFATKAWQDYVARRDKDGKRGRVWFWHVKGSDFADIVWQDVVGRMLVEVAKVDNTPRGNSMFHALTHAKEYKEIAPYGWGTSHGFAYRRSDKQDGVYHFVEKFESTVLPYHRASNLYGGIMSVKEVLDMKITKEKEQALVTLFGEDEAAKILAEPLEASKVLESLVDFKEKGDDTGADSDEDGGEDADKKKKVKVAANVDEDGEEDTEGADEETKDVDDKGDVYELELDETLMKAIASHVDVSDQVATALKEVLPELSKQLAEQFATAEKAMTDNIRKAVADSDVASKEQIIKDAISGRLKLTPYTASKDDGNELGDGEKEEFDEAQKAKDKYAGNDPVKGVVQAIMAGNL